MKLRGRLHHHRDGDRVYRFGRTERLVHWLNAAAFFALVATGSLLFFRTTFLLTHPQIAALRRLHFWIGGFYWLVPGTVFLLGDPRGYLAWCMEAFGWAPSEFVWLMGPLRRLLLPRAQEAEVGRFNAGQRMNMLGQVVLKPTLAVTGILIYIRTGALAPFVIHLTGSAMLIGLVAGHIYMSVMHPATRESVTAMVDGYVRSGFVEHHHPAWYRRLPHRRPRGDATNAPEDRP